MAKSSILNKYNNEIKELRNAGLTNKEIKNHIDSKYGINLTLVSYIRFTQKFDIASSNKSDLYPYKDEIISLREQGTTIEHIKEHICRKYGIDLSYPAYVRFLQLHFDDTRRKVKGIPIKTNAFNFLHWLGYSEPVIADILENGLNSREVRRVNNIREQLKGGT